MEKTYTEEQIRAAITGAAPDSVAELFYDDLTEKIVAALTARKLCDDVPVLDASGAAWGHYKSVCPSLRNGARALIPVDEAREIARRAVTALTVSVANRNIAMAEVDRDLDAYQYGEET